MMRKRTLGCIVALMAITALMITACGQPASDTENLNLGKAPEVENTAGMEECTDAVQAGLKTDQSEQEDEVEVLAMRFDISSEAEEELQRMLEDSGDKNIFWIEPVRG